MGSTNSLSAVVGSLPSGITRGVLFDSKAQEQIKPASKEFVSNAIISFQNTTLAGRMVAFGENPAKAFVNAARQTVREFSSGNYNPTNVPMIPYKATEVRKLREAVTGQQEPLFGNEAQMKEKGIINY